MRYVIDFLKRNNQLNLSEIAAFHDAHYTKNPGDLHIPPREQKEKLNNLSVRAGSAI